MSSTAMQPSARFNETIAKIAETKPIMLLQRAIALAPMAFRVVATHAPYREQLTEQDYDQMLATATGNQFRLFPATLEPLNNINGQYIVSFIAEANTAVKDYSEPYVREHMRVLSSNVFVDDSDNSIWRVVENGDQKYLVQSIKEDYAKLIGERLARRASQVVSSANYAGIVPANGDYLQFYASDKGNLAYGFALSSDGKLQVGERESGKLIEIAPAHVVAAVQGTSLEKKYSLAQHMINETGGTAVLAEEISPAALTAFVDYFRTLYSNTDFFASLEKLVRNRRSQPRITELMHD